MPAGTNVPSGVLVSPGGQQGIPGPSSIGLPFVTQTAAYTLTSADVGKYFICSGGYWTLTLPSTPIGYFQVRNDQGITGTTGTITVAAPTGTINGMAAIWILPQQECTIFTDGTNWRTFGLKREVILGTADITTSTVSASVLLPNGYRYFELYFDAFVPGTAGDGMYLQFSNTGGSSWITTNNYYTGTLYNPTNSTAGYSDVEGTNTIAIIPGNSTNPAPCKVTLYPGDTTHAPYARYDCGLRNNANYQNAYYGIGYCFSVSGPVNAVIYATAHTIANLMLTVKGVV